MAKYVPDTAALTTWAMESPQFLPGLGEQGVNPQLTEPSAVIPSTPLLSVMARHNPPQMIKASLLPK